MFGCAVLTVYVDLTSGERGPHQIMDLSSNHGSVLLKFERTIEVIITFEVSFYLYRLIKFQ